MKKFWLVFLSLGLVMTFSASAFAVDVQVSGSYYAAGMYLNQTSLMRGSTDKSVNPYTGVASGLPNNDDVSTAFFFQRLRVRTDFIISPGLKFITRFDAMERIWGGARSTPGTFDTQSAGTRAERQNIAFDWAYIEYTSPIGLFQVGYGEDNVWGTVFGSSSSGPPSGQISYGAQIGPVTFGAAFNKENDGSYSAVNPPPPGVTWTDTDYDRYSAFGIYNFKGGETGLAFSYNRFANDKQFPSSLSAPGMGAWGVPLNMGGSFIPFTNMMYIYTLEPYAKVKLGPVKLEAQVIYGWGSINMEDGVRGFDLQLQDIMAYLNAVVDLAPVYFGGTVAYMSGDNGQNGSQVKGNVLGGGMDWNPCLIMFNQDLTYWAGPINGYGGSYNFSGSYPNTGYGGMTNAWFSQIKAGVRPISNLDINTSVSYAQADQIPAGWAGNSYGWELDVTGTYKISNNLSYMVGAGYWVVGDYYKGLASEQNDVRDEYMVINKLTLTF